jgi:hypothetical protein
MISQLAKIQFSFIAKEVILLIFNVNSLTKCLFLRDKNEISNKHHVINNSFSIHYLVVCL